MSQVPLPLGVKQTFVLGGQIINICFYLFVFIYLIVVSINICVCIIIIIIISIIGFLGQFRQMSSQCNHQSILFRAKSNATEKGHSISFYD